MRKATLLAIFVALLLASAPNIYQPLALAAPPSPTAVVPTTARPPFLGDLKPDELPGRLPQASGAAPQGQVPAHAFHDATKIAFQSYRDNNWEIYIAKGDALEQTRLTNNGAADTYPRLNRGCTQLAFASKRAGSYEIYTMNPDGSQVRQLTFNESDDIAPAWSPDGTKIAFQSYRDGQAEIYVMNADGSGQTRLTANAAYDGQPAWSPDGTRIAFMAYRNQQYRIWVMQADGTNQVQLSGQPYSEFPVWSPDGTQLAYDADADGNGFQEIWLMNADGSNQRLVYRTLEANTDLLARSWSSDGNWLAYTRLNLIYYQGNWYWTAAYLELWYTPEPHFYNQLPGSGRDWYPDWQTCDIWPPTSRVDPLPPESPASFRVTITGADVGQAGIWFYYAESSVNGGPWSYLIDGNWMDPAATWRSVTGRAGDLFAFRVRARDNTGNWEPLHQTPDAWTRIETSPPLTAFDPLPSYSRKSPFTVSWRGVDPGGSGISGYFVDYKDMTQAGNWIPWLDNVTETSVQFTGASGHRYCFRMRANDWAGNGGAWTADGQIQCTTAYDWAVAGNVRSNRGEAVGGATLATIPPALDSAVTDAAGRATAYLATGSAAADVGWSKPGYGALPTTTLATTADADLLAVLPPVDNVTLDPGFESGGLVAGPWLPLGAGGAVISTTARHTGAYGLEIGWAGPSLSATELISDVADPVGPPRMVAGSDGTVHVVWRYGYTLLYSRRGADGLWSEAEVVGQQEVTWPDSTVAVDSGGVVHVAWDHSSQIFHAQRPITGTWSVQEIIGSFGYMGASPIILTGPGGVLHVYWDNYDFLTNSWTVQYATRGSGGVWLPSVGLAAPQPGPTEPQMAVGEDGSVHAVWYGNAGGAWHVAYARRPAGGVWSVEENVSGNVEGVRKPAVLLGGDGAVHVAFGVSGQSQFYTRRGPAGGWSAPIPFGNTALSAYCSVLKADGLGRLHRVWGDRYAAYHSTRSTEGAWSPAQQLCQNSACEMDTDGLGVAVDADGLVHVAVKASVDPDGPIWYLRRSADGLWSSPRPVASDVPRGKSPVLSLDGQGVAHVAWASGGSLPSSYSAAHASLPFKESPGTYGVGQSITVPITLSSPTLSFMYRRSDDSRLASVRLGASVDNGVTSTVVLSRVASSAPWSQAWADLTPWAGQTITVSFSITRSGGGAPGTVLLDEVTIGSSFPGVWLAADGGEALPGEDMALRVRYGNRSSMPAAGVRITATLPSALDFPASVPGPVSGTATITWDLGALPAGFQGSLGITGWVPTSVLAVRTYQYTVTATTASRELDLEDNQANETILVGRRRFLPLVMRSAF